MCNSRQNNGRAPSVLAANALFLLSGIGLVLVSLFSGNIANALFRLFPTMSQEMASLVLNAMYYLAAILLPICVYARKKGCDAQALRLNPLSFKATAALVIMALVGVMLVMEITALWTFLLEALGCNTAYMQQTMPATTNGLLIYMAASCMLPGICEELLFRGVVLSAWERRGGLRAIIISAVLFTVLHGSVAGMPAELLLGLVISFLVIACNSLYAGIIYHTVHNSAAMILAFLVEKMQPVDQAAAQAESAAFTVVDIISLVLSLGYHAAIFSVFVVMFRRRMKRHEISLAPDTGVKMSGREWAVLIFGIVTVLFLYAVDILFLTNILN